ncbi:DMT family transporter [Cupriavidus sp. 2TAF22]|uniref:DMT family transporter n=1 Tax=unclassified Cupriavidus TaxID=2640874 RepID=UPI003F91FD4E
MDSRKPVDAQAIGLMLVLCLVWGLQQVALKAVARDISPLLQIALRSGIAAVLVALLMARRGERLFPRDGTWGPGAVVGGLFALEYLLVGEGLRLTTASHMVVFLYTAPIFAALGLHWKLPAERLRVPQWAGIALAFAGIALAFMGGNAGGDASGDAANMLLGDLLGLLAGLAWGATTVMIRCSSLARAPATQTLLYQLAGAFLLLLPAAAVLGQASFNPTALAWGSLAFQALVVSFASFLTWFWLLRKYLASRLGVFSFMTPLFGVGFGAWLLGETLEPDFLAGALLVLAGIVLVSGYELLAQALATRARQRGRA